MRLLIWWCRWPIIEPQRTDTLYASFYPTWWKGQEDWFVGPLATNPMRPSVWLSGRPWTLWRQRKQIGEFLRQTHAVLLQTWVSWRTVLSVVSPVWWWRRVQCQLRGAVAWQGFDIREIVNEEVQRSLSQPDFFRCLLMQSAWRELTTAYPPQGVVYRMERQGWEAALLQGVGNRAKTCGFVHSLWGCNYLPYYEEPGAWHRS